MSTQNFINHVFIDINRGQNTMWNLDDESKYVKVHSFSLPEAFTYADTRKGHTDKDKRERIRARAAKDFPHELPIVKWWAFRINIKKTTNRRFDIENVLKPLIDAFCKRQILEDKSQCAELGLYDDDTIDFVRIIEVGGSRSREKDTTEVEIFGCK
jgi:Holliday junction resolvase RusA-like endonuclease